MKLLLLGFVPLVVTFAWPHAVKRDYAEIVDSLACVTGTVNQKIWLDALTNYVDKDQMKQLRRIFDQDTEQPFNPDVKGIQKELRHCPYQSQVGFTLAERIADEAMVWHASCMFRYGTRTYYAYLDNLLDYNEEDHQDPEIEKRMCGDSYDECDFLWLRGVQEDYKMS